MGRVSSLTPRIAHTIAPYMAEFVASLWCEKNEVRKKILGFVGNEKKSFFYDFLQIAVLD
jgi:hypothetical protein